MTADAPLQQRFGLTVTPQNVLGVRAVVLQEANELQDLLNNEGLNVMLRRLGTDFVSRDMSREFNAVTAQLVDRATKHIATLFELGEELGITAKDYGHTEADIKASLERQPTDSSKLPLPFRQAAGMGTSAARPSARTLGDLMIGAQK